LQSLETDTLVYATVNTMVQAVDRAPIHCALQLITTIREYTSAVLRLMKSDEPLNVKAMVVLARRELHGAVCQLEQRYGHKRRLEGNTGA